VICFYLFNSVAFICDLSRPLFDLFVFFVFNFEGFRWLCGVRLDCLFVLLCDLVHVTCFGWCFFWLFRLWHDVILVCVDCLLLCYLGFV